MPGGRSRWLAIVIWTAWLGYAAWIAIGPFQVQAEYFRRPGTQYYRALGIAIALLVAFCAVYVGVLRRKLWTYELPVLAGLAATVALINQPKALILAIVLCLACAVAGHGLSRRLGLTLESPLEILTTGFAVGCALLIPLLFVLGLLGLYHVWVFLGLLALPFLGFRREAREVTLGVLHWFRAARENPQLAHPMCGVAVIFGGIALVCVLAVMLSPSTIYDSLATHLPAAQYYVEQHALKPVPALDYSYYPQGFELLLTFAYALGGQPAAQMIAPLFFVLFLLQLLQIARFSELDMGAAAIGVTVIALTPFLLWTGSQTKNDMAMALFQAAALYNYLCWRRSGHPIWLISGAAFLGTTFSIKHTALFGAVPLGLLFLWGLLRERRRGWLAVAFLTTLITFGFYWHVRTFVLTGNPVFPEQLQRSVSGAVVQHGHTLTEKLSRYAKLPSKVLFEGRPSFETTLDNPVGMFVVVFVPLVFLIRRRPSPARRACLFFVVFYLVYWASILSSLRYAVTPIALLILFLAAKVKEFYDQPWTAFRGGVRISVLVALCGSMLFGMLGCMIISLTTGQAALLTRQSDTSDYLRSMLRSYGALEFVRRLNVQSNEYGVGTCAIAYSGNPGGFYCSSSATHGAEIAHTRESIQRRHSGYVLIPAEESEEEVRALLSGFQAEEIYRDTHYSVFRLNGAP